MRAARAICNIDKVFLVQPMVEGHDYRVVVLDGEVLSAYERLPLTVTGDGTLTIDQLLSAKQDGFKSGGRDTKIQTNDFRIDNRLRRFRMTRATILPAGSSFALLDNRNLSSGGDAIDVTEAIHPTFRTLASDIVKTMGLRYCGLDLMVKKDIREPLDPQNNSYQVIEINAAPGVDNYAQSGDQQKRIVTEMYRKILLALSKGGDTVVQSGVRCTSHLTAQEMQRQLYGIEDF